MAIKSSNVEARELIRVVLGEIARRCVQPTDDGVRALL